MSEYDPNNVGLSNGHIFSLPHNYGDAEIILIPVPWDVTVSYRDGTSNGPKEIVKASSQLDFHHPSGAKIWEYGVFILPQNEQIEANNIKFRPKAKAHIELLENDAFDINNQAHISRIEEINSACKATKNAIKNSVLSALNDGKKVGLLGGDHSCALGIIEALTEQHSDFGILQIDAHADLRGTYENFTYSHASIFHNSLLFRQIQNLTQVGIRDISPNEADVIKTDKRINCYYDWSLKGELFNGKCWSDLCEEIVKQLPQKIYISFDIDGLQPNLCPNTGTPVPGGLSYEQAIHLIDTVVRHKKQIIGFDLCEVSVGESNNDWDGNVGARILFQLCTALHLSGN